MLKIRGWKKFQHFKDRTPPWIKLYRELLDDPDWHALDGEAAKTLTMLWLLASEDQSKSGAIPDIRKAAFRLRMSEAELSAILRRLSDWIEVLDINAISPRYQLDAPEGETETETEGETEAEARSSSNVQNSAREADSRSGASAAAVDNAFTGLVTAMSLAGFRHEAVHQPKSFAMLREWIAQGVTPEDIGTVAAMLRERQPGKNFGPTYMQPPMADYLEAKRNGHATSRRPSSNSAAQRNADLDAHLDRKIRSVT